VASPVGQQICIRLRSDGPIASCPAERRVVARVVLEQAREEQLLAFGLGDSGLHLETTGSPEAGSQLARRIELSLGRRLRLPSGFERARLRSIESGWHLYRAFEHVLTRNGPDKDPLFDGTNLPDLLGLRVIGPYTADNVRQQLPRIKRRDLLRCLGVPELELADGPVEWALDAALAAAGLARLSGHTAEERDARRAVIEVVGPRMRAPELAGQLGSGERSIYRLKQTDAPARLVAATRLQLGLMRQRGRGAMFAGDSRRR
jgi:hypothetical protein